MLEPPRSTNRVPAAPARRLLRFAEFEADLTAGRLLKGGARIGLRYQAFEILALLLERPGEVVTREELRRRLWPDDVSSISRTT
jgi:DNA-binding winged helix-turn-helix (wHTH) protein